MISTDVEVFNVVEGGILYSTNSMRKFTSKCQNSTTTSSVMGTHKILILRGCQIHTPNIHYKALNIERTVTAKDKLIEINDCCNTIKLEDIKITTDIHFHNRPITGLDQIKDLKGEIIQTESSWKNFKMGLPEFKISFWTSLWILCIILVIVLSIVGLYIYIKYFRMPGRLEATLGELLELRNIPPEQHTRRTDN